MYYLADFFGDDNHLLILLFMKEEETYSSDILCVLGF